MLKRILSIMLAAVMILSVVPVTSFAAEFSPMSVVSNIANVAASATSGDTGTENKKVNWFEELFRIIFGYYKIGDEDKLIKAANEGGSKWKLKKSFTISNECIIKKDITIKGNGKTISRSADNGPIFTCSANMKLDNVNMSAKRYCITMNGGSLTVVNGGSYASTEVPALYISKNGIKVTLNSTTVESSNSKAIYNSGYMTINGGTVGSIQNEKGGTIVLDNGYIKTLYYYGDINKSLTNKGGKIDKTVRIDEPVPSTLKINLTSPSVDATTITEGSSLGIHGTITSNYNITKVEGYILNSADAIEQSKSCTPNATSFTLDKSVINNNLKFDELGGGKTYTLLIRAKDASENVRETRKTVNVTVKDDTEIPDITKGWYWPLSKKYTSISSSFGYRPSMGDYHQGIDISSSGIDGQPIYAARKGTVVYVGLLGNAGNIVTIKHGTYKGATIYTTYMHMKSKGRVSVGQTVDTNTVIGYVGGTGTNGNIQYGPHLHFQICKNDKNPNHSNNNQLTANYYNPSPSKISYSYIH